MKTSYKAIASIAILFFVIACKTGSLPRHKSYTMPQTYINIKGLIVPAFTEDKKIFVETPALSKDFENSIPISYIRNKYPDLDYEYSKGFEKFAQNHLIKEDGDKGFHVYDNRYHANFGENSIVYYYNAKNILQKFQISTLHKFPVEEETFKEMLLKRGSDSILSGITSTYEYNPNGTIKHFSSIVSIIGFSPDQLYCTGMPIGVEYNFDQSGILLKLVDHEGGFKMTFPQVFTAALRGRSSLSNKYDESLEVYEVRRNLNDRGSFWIINYINKGGNQKFFYLIIDDASGRVVIETEGRVLESGKYGEVSEKRLKDLRELRADQGNLMHGKPR